MKLVQLHKKVQIAGVRDIITTDNNKPIIETRDIKSCIEVLIICEKEAYLTPLETLQENDRQIKELETIKKYITKVEFNPKENNKLAEILKEWNRYPAYLENRNGSITYDFSTNQFYGLDEDRIFYEYRLGSINKKNDHQKVIIKMVILNKILRE